MCTFSTFRAGFCTRQAYNQDRLMRSSCAIISRMHSAEHACTVRSMHAQCRACMQDSTSMCSIRDFPYNEKSHLQATATIRERHMYRCAVQKCGLYPSGFYARLYGSHDMYKVSSFCELFELCRVNILGNSTHLFLNGNWKIPCL